MEKVDAEVKVTGAWAEGAPKFPPRAKLSVRPLLRGRAFAPRLLHRPQQQTTVALPQSIANRPIQLKIFASCNVEPTAPPNKQFVPTKHNALAKAPPAVAPPSTARAIDCERSGSRKPDANDGDTSAEYAWPWRLRRRNVRGFFGDVGEDTVLQHIS